MLQDGSGEVVCSSRADALHISMWKLLKHLLQWMLPSTGSCIQWSLLRVVANPPVQAFFLVQCAGGHRHIYQPHSQWALQLPSGCLQPTPIVHTIHLSLPLRLCHAVPFKHRGTLTLPTLIPNTSQFLQRNLKAQNLLGKGGNSHAVFQM